MASIRKRMADIKPSSSTEAITVQRHLIALPRHKWKSKSTCVFATTGEAHSETAVLKKLLKEHSTICALPIILQQTITVKVLVGWLRETPLRKKSDSSGATSESQQPECDAGNTQHRSISTKNIAFTKNGYPRVFLDALLVISIWHRSFIENTSDEKTDP